MPPILSTLKSGAHDDDDEDRDASSQSSCASSGATEGLVADHPVHQTAPSPGDGPGTTSAKKAKRRSPRKKKTKTKTKPQRPPRGEAVDPLPGHPRHVRFGSVTVRQYARTMGTHVVPHDGAWPLGLSDDLLGETVIDVEQYEIDKHERWRQRWEKLPRGEERSGGGGAGGGEATASDDGWSLIRQGSSSILSFLSSFAGDDRDFNTTTDNLPPVLVLESRQWDYKRTKNPIFGPLPEKERMALLLWDGSDESGGHRSDDVTAGVADGSASLPPAPFRKGRSRSRSSSFSESQQYNAAYPRGEVHHVRTELEQIRVSRDQLGCDCRKLHVYVPPTDGSGGKKAQKRRLSVKRVQDELRKRNLLPSQPVSRDELERILLHAVEQEPCCSSDSCPCAQNSIECQDNACACWKPSHQGLSRLQAGAAAEDEGVGSDNGEAPADVPPRSLQVRCGNPLGIVTVNWDQIDNVRNLYCREIKM